MKANLQAFILLVFLGASATAQQSAFPTSTDTPLSNNASKTAELRAKADKGDAAAQTEIGQIYERGNDVPQDYVEAAKWYRKAAEQGYAHAQCQLGDMYGLGQGVAYDEAEALKWWRKAADQYRKSAEQGGASGQWELGRIYLRLHQNADDQYYADGLKWIRKAAEMGNADALNHLGNYYSIYHHPKDYAEAAKWYRQAAEKGNADAQDSLGDAYSTGEGVATNLTEATKWWLKAAEQGNSDAEDSLGDAYSTGKGVAANQAEAVKWFRKAADQGRASAQDEIGDRYRFGNGVAQDYGEAVRWYRKAAEQGDADAQWKLGLSYDDGKGVPQDFGEAVTWYLKAAERGNAAAQCNLGVMYGLGKGVPQDYVEAYKWDNLAAAQNETNAIHNRDSISDSMTASQIAEGQQLSREFVAGKVHVLTADEWLKKQGAPAVGDVPRFTGTGFFVTGDGCLLTCYHVVEDAARITIQTKAGTFLATLVKADKANDVALLKVTGTFSALPISSSRGVKLGASVFTIGFPNIELQGFAPKLAKGEIASLTGPQDDPRYFQISAPMQPGNSGGALVDDRCNVVGVVSAKLDAATALAASGALPENVNYAIKSSLLLTFLESVPDVAAKMREPGTKENKFEDAVHSAEQAAALVLIY